MVLEVMKIDELLKCKADYNPRVELKEGDDEFEKLKNSILEFGYVDPVIYNKTTGTIIGGHQRLNVLKSLGYKEVGVSVVELDELKEKALNIALNKIEGFWDETKLTNLLSELKEKEYNIELTGFNNNDFTNFIDNLTTETELNDIFEEFSTKTQEKEEEYFLTIGKVINIKLNKEEYTKIVEKYNNLGSQNFLGLLKGD